MTTPRPFDVHCLNCGVGIGEALIAERAGNLEGERPMTKKKSKARKKQNSARCPKCKSTVTSIIGNGAETRRKNQCGKCAHAWPLGGKATTAPSAKSRCRTASMNAIDEAVAAELGVTRNGVSLFRKAILKRICIQTNAQLCDCAVCKMIAGQWRRSVASTGR